VVDMNTFSTSTLKYETLTASFWGQRLVFEVEVAVEIEKCQLLFFFR